MKKLQYIYALGLASILTFSCSEDALNPESVFTDISVERNALDNYIDNNYVKDYNIGVVYKYVDGESDMNYNLSPASYESSVRMTRLFEYLGIEPYDVVTGDKSFIKSYFPKVLNYVGSPAYRNNGTMVLGTAEGGRKITMYNLNALNKTTGANPTFLNYYYFHTIHHEFGHILNQTKDFPRSFNAISSTNYVADSWNTEYSDNTAPAKGFISAYASKEASEDFVEVYSFYITLTPAEWEAKLALGGTTGRSIIEAKLDIVKAYFMNSWKINLDDLRTEILKRQADLPSFDQLKID